MLIFPLNCFEKVRQVNLPLCRIFGR